MQMKNQHGMIVGEMTNLFQTLLGSTDYKKLCEKEGMVVTFEVKFEHISKEESHVMEVVGNISAGTPTSAEMHAQIHQPVFTTTGTHNLLVRDVYRDLTQDLNNINGGNL